MLNVTCAFFFEKRQFSNCSNHRLMELDLATQDTFRNLKAAMLLLQKGAVLQTETSIVLDLESNKIENELPNPIYTNIHDEQRQRPQIYQASKTYAKSSVLKPIFQPHKMSMPVV